MGMITGGASEAVNDDGWNVVVGLLSGENAIMGEEVRGGCSEAMEDANEILAGSNLLKKDAGKNGPFSGQAVKGFNNDNS